LSTLRQEPVVRQVLPVASENLHEMIEGLTPKTGKFSELKTQNSELETEPYLFEPSREAVLKELTDRLFKMTLYHIQLESNASEHSARMVAMKTASDNAAEIVDDLTLIYNKGRQAKITQEIMEITSGSDAVG
jgi:F-type H+-transporting ATPase subunit gamma